VGDGGDGALNGMKVGAYAGQGAPADFKFQLVICADGSVDRIKGRQRRRAAGRRDQECARVAEAAEGPAGGRREAGSKCKAIKYIFTWSGKGQAGKVK
jgi:hypothetical protein